MKKSTRTAVAALAIFVLGGLVLLKFVVPAALQYALSTLELQFPDATWRTESSLMIAANNSETLNNAWGTLESGRTGASSEGRFAEVGRLTLPSGELFATDLNFPEDNFPFRLHVPPGQYPVYESHQSKGSFVAVVISDDQPVEWVIADNVQDTASELESSEGVWGVSLDSSAILVDGLACQKQLTYNPSTFFDGLTRTVIIEPGSGMNVLRVELGGVGVHPAYWGLNANSEPAVLVVLSGWSQTSSNEPAAQP